MAAPPASPSLSASQLATLAALGEGRTAGVGDVLYRVGDATYPFIAIRDGEVAILDAAGNEIVRHGESKFLGEMNLLTGQTVFLTAIVTKPLRYVAVHRDALRAHLRRRGRPLRIYEALRRRGRRRIDGGPVCPPASVCYSSPSEMSEDRTSSIEKAMTLGYGYAEKHRHDRLSLGWIARARLPSEVTANVDPAEITADGIADPVAF